MNKLNRVLIISGIYKNSKIFFSKKYLIKPTKAIIKKSLFSLIENNIKDKVCLDLYSGTGSLGIESISRGARTVFFNDLKKKNIKDIKKNLINLKINKNSYFLSSLDSVVFLKKNLIKYDIIFIDMPFKYSNEIKIIFYLSYVSTRVGGLIYIESNLKINFNKNGFSSIKVGKKSKVFYYLIKKK